MTRRELVGAAALAAAGAVPIEPEQLRLLTPVPISQVTIDDPFWSPKLKLWREVTIGDCLTKFENDRGGAINNFDLVRDGKVGRHAGPPWYDGLVYEMIRGAADFLAAQRDTALEARIDGYIARIVAAQSADPSGYINTWTQAMLPQTQRWGMNGGDDREQHDVYNAGMMIEAGVHYYRATGKPVLLRAATRLADLMCRTIGPPPRANVVPGHSGPEEALVKLFRLYRDSPDARRAGNSRRDYEAYARLAAFFIDARGRYEGRTGRAKSFGEYGQDQAPLAQQPTLEGHAVRATLFCTGIAPAAAVINRPEYVAAARRFWESLVRHKMYISGAAGAIAGDEKLGPDYFLPNDGYMETCAAVGLAFFAHNMNLLFADGRYVDEMERALYNAALGGVALSGDHYYYQNPLAGEGLRRWSWHECPCCPPMFLKLMGALPGYLYARSPGALYLNLYAGSHAKLDITGTKLSIRQFTRYPWECAVRFELLPERPLDMDLYLRIPQWCQTSRDGDLYRWTGAAESITLKVNGRTVPVRMARGYACVRRKWRNGDVVALDLPMPVRRIKADPRVEADRGLVSLARGPIVYCAEGVDNPEGIRQLVVPEDAIFEPRNEPELLGGVRTLHGNVRALRSEHGEVRARTADLTLVPFYASANRKPCSMRVWMPAEDAAAVPATLATRSRASASHCWHLDSVAAINDGIAPVRSSDTSKSHLSWWGHKGTKEWAQLDFPSAAEVSSVRVFWFADRPVHGGCDLPKSWRLLYRDGGDWRPVAASGPFGLEIDRYNAVTFTPVRTTALRIEVELQPGWSAGICEWQVE